MRRYFASPWVEAQRRHLVAAAAGPTPRALDLGCGKGRHAMLLTDLGFEVTAVDCDGASLAQLRQREDKVKIVQMDLEEAGTSLMSLGHFDVLLVVNFACRSLLPKLPKLLKDDGIFIFESWAQGNESYATPKDAKALQGLLRPNELLEATADFTVLAYAHGLQEGYEGRDCVKQMICCKKNPQPGPHGHVVCPLARLLSGDAAFLEDAAFGKSWVHGVRAALELDFGIEELLNLLVGYDPATARKEYLARMGSSASRPALWDVVLVRRTEGRTESMKPEEVKEFLSKTDLKTKADVLKRGEGWTLVVSQLQGAPALAELHRRLFAATGLGGGINAYLTPPGSIGKPPHIDDHDVVVLQLSGSKCWTLLDDSRSNPRAEVTLAPKDVMYLPQGIPHHAAALAVDDPSLHLAVALHRRPMALSSVLAALLTLRSLDPGEGAMLQASVVEEMEGRSQSFAAFGAREHWLNQLLPMHLPLVHALAPEDVEIGILEAFCDLLHRRALDLAELVRSQDCSDADVGLPPGTARQRALLRASAAGSEMELEEAAKLPKQDDLDRTMTGSQKELSPNDSADFPWRCKVREQLKLEAAPDVRVIVLHIIQLTQGAEKVLGSVMLDALDSKNHAETVQEALYDPRGHRLESYLKVKLATATPASAVSAVSVPVIQQDPVAVRAVPVPAAVPDVKSGAHSEPQAEEADDEEVELVYEEDPEEEPADDDPEEEV